MFSPSLVIFYKYLQNGKRFSLGTLGFSPKILRVFMPNFELLASVIHKKIEWMWSKSCKVLVTGYVLLISPQFFALGLFILVFWACAIIHQQLVAMLRGLMRFVYKLQLYLEKGNEYHCECL